MTPSRPCASVRQRVAHEPFSVEAGTPPERTVPTNKDGGFLSTPEGGASAHGHRACASAPAAHSGGVLRAPACATPSPAGPRSALDLARRVLAGEQTYAPVTPLDPAPAPLPTVAPSVPTRVNVGSPTYPHMVPFVAEGEACLDCGSREWLRQGAGLWLCSEGHYRSEVPGPSARVIPFSPDRRARTEARLAGTSCTACGWSWWQVSPRGDAWCVACRERAAGRTPRCGTCKQTTGWTTVDGRKRCGCTREASL